MSGVVSPKNEAERKFGQFKRLVLAVIRREPRGHISDLWGEFTGKLVLCGLKPHQYLMLKSEIKKGN